MMTHEDYFLEMTVRELCECDLTNELLYLWRCLGRYDQKSIVNLMKRLCDE